MHYSWFEYGIDVSDTDPLTKGGTLASSDTVYTYTRNSEINIKWTKAAENVNITKGQHELTFKQTLDIYSRLYGLSDCIAIVPSGMNWQPSATDKADAGRTSLDATAVEYVLNNKYPDGTKENIYMPQMGSAGSRYAYETSNAAIIAENGKITRIVKDQVGSIGVTAKINDTASETKQISILVLAKEPPVVTDFAIKNSAGEDLTSLTGQETITVSANISDDAENAKGAVIILALYDSNGAFKGMEIGNIEQLTATPQQISTTMTLPTDVSGMYVKAFLWEDLSDIVSFANCIEVGKN